MSVGIRLGMLLALIGLVFCLSQVQAQDYYVLISNDKGVQDEVAVHLDVLTTLDARIEWLADSLSKCADEAERHILKLNAIRVLADKASTLISYYELCLAQTESKEEKSLFRRKAAEAWAVLRRLEP